MAILLILFSLLLPFVYATEDIRAKGPKIIEWKNYRLELSEKSGHCSVKYSGPSTGELTLDSPPGCTFTLKNDDSGQLQDFRHGSGAQVTLILWEKELSTKEAKQSYLFGSYPKLCRKIQQALIIPKDQTIFSSHLFIDSDSECFRNDKYPEFDFASYILFAEEALPEGRKKALAEKGNEKHQREFLNKLKPKVDPHLR